MFEFFILFLKGALKPISFLSFLSRLSESEICDESIIGKIV